MGSLEISAPGAERLALALDAAARDLGDFSDPSAAAAHDVLGVVDPPIRTGRLASTVEAVPDALGFTLTAGGSVAPYAGYVHARDPFLTDALDDRQTAVVDQYADYVADVVGTIKGD